MKNFVNSIPKTIHSLMLLLLTLSLLMCSSPNSIDNSADIVIENVEMRLIIGENGIAKSLLHIPSGQECLMPGVQMPVFGITQDYPYDNENKLAFPAKEKTFASNHVIRKGDSLVINFEHTDYEAVVTMDITDSYFAFTLEKLDYRMSNVGDKRKTRIDEFTLLQLPIKDREHFGEWLNVMWDDEVAVNLLATVSTCRIDAFSRPGYKVFQAAGVIEVQLEGISAALITVKKDDLLDVIDRFERDFDLPLGVESRRSEDYKYSYYEIKDLTPENIDEHIEYAKKGGFKHMVIYYPDFAKSMGHFDWREEYPNGMKDLKEIVQKIKAAGMIVGFHIHYNKAQINDAYVTPVPDSRLNLRQHFTLREDLSKDATTITVEENPIGCTTEDDRRILKFGTELITYESYTTTTPYKFINCKRAHLDTKPERRKKGDILGLLDVDTWPIFVRFNQQTDIQQEVALRLKEFIDELGFEFIYYDGAEDVHPPYWYNVSQSQLDVYDILKTKQLFAEGAQKSHFGWHLLSRGNAFDDFPPEVFKVGLNRYPLAEAELLANDFSSINFGWIHPVVPDSQTIGTQPDMVEYAESKATGWNSVISIVGKLDVLNSSARTDDYLEVVKRWEEFRVKGSITDVQRKDLQNPNKEHILLINEKGEYELIVYKQIDIPAENKSIRAFIFNRNNKTWVVYWHTSGEGNLELDINAKDMTLHKELGAEIPVQQNNNKVTLPVGNRRYIEFNLSEKAVLNLFLNASLK